MAVFREFVFGGLTAMIVNLRGTSGSGKSTVVRGVMGRWPHAPVAHTKTARGARPLVYRVDAPARPLFVFGNYETECGGVDTISDYKTIIPALLTEYAPRGDVLYEGMLISGTYGSIGPVLQRLDAAGAGPVVIAFLDTPLAVCLERVRARRVARGDVRPFNTANTEGKHRAIISIRKRMEREYKMCCVTIDNTNAVEAVLALLGLRAAAPASAAEPITAA